MQQPFIIYVRALGIYLMLTVPALIFPVIYFISAWYSFTSGFIAMVIFALIYYVLYVTRPPYPVVLATLCTGVVAAVMAAFKILLLVSMPERWFWLMDIDTLYPMAAILAGWLSLAFSTQKIKEHFIPPIEEEGFESIFS